MLNILTGKLDCRSLEGDVDEQYYSGTFSSVCRVEHPSGKLDITSFVAAPSLKSSTSTLESHKTEEPAAKKRKCPESDS